MMDRVILYGAGATFRCFEKLFSELSKEGKVRIVGIADKRLKEKVFHDFSVLRLEDIANNDLKFDFVIITTVDAVARSIYEDLCKEGISKDKIVDVYNYPYIEKKLNQIDNDQLPVQLDIIQKLLTAKDEDVTNFLWMRDIVGKYGIYPWRAEDMDGTGNVVGTRVGILQRPNEFAEYCVYLSKWKIDTAIEVGVFRGKSSYFMCALLARRNPDLVYELVDINDDLSNFEEFYELLPQMRKRIPSTSDDYIGKIYDFVFIDADHSYDASMRDYMNLGQYAKKLTVFHDIYAHEYDYLNGGTVRMWNEVVDMTPQHNHHIFSEFPNEWMGIGVVEHVK